jgi:hypothetical protein
MLSIADVIRPWPARRIFLALLSRRFDPLCTQFLQAATDRVKVIGGIRLGHSTSPIPWAAWFNALS